MKNYTFHWDIRTVLAQFEDAFNDIVINRFNKEREPKDKIHVNFRFAPKTRTLHEIVEKNEHFKMPVVAVTVGGIQRNPNRVFNKIEGSYWADTSSPATSAWMHLLQPVPVDVTVNMSIVARFQADVDQILTNFIPYCDPYIVTSWRWPGIVPFDDFEIRSHIKWNENIQFQYPLDIANNAPYRIIADTSFTIEGWMFKNNPGDGGPIYVIDHEFTAVNELSSYEVMKDWAADYNTDYWTTSATDVSAGSLSGTTTFWTLCDGSIPSG